VQRQQFSRYTLRVTTIVQFFEFYLFISIRSVDDDNKDDDDDDDGA